MATSAGRVLSVSVGAIREFEFSGRPAKSAIWKSPAAGRIAAQGVNLDGDDQADRKAHGGPDKAVYAYAVEDARWWELKIGRSFAYGEFGENLTTEGIEVNDALVGERWEIGTTVLEVSEPRIPCWRLGVRMKDPIFPRRFAEAMRPGAYLRIVVEGSVGAGDEIRVAERPSHELTIQDVSRIYTRDRDEVERLLAVPRCPGVGGDGRKIFFKGPKAAPWTLANLDVARCQRHRISQWAITSSGCRRTPACRSRDSQSAPTNFCTHPRKVRHLIPDRTNDRRKAKE